MGIVDRIADAGLGGEVDDALRVVVCKQFLDCLAVFQVGFAELEPAVA